MSLLALLLGCPADVTEPVTRRPTPREVEPWRPLAPLSAVYGRDGVVVGAPWAGAAKVGVSLVAWGAEGALVDVAEVAPTRVGDRTLYARDGLLEWWERHPGGLEQGFVIDEPPTAGTLVLELGLRGAVAEVDDDGRSATWLPEAGGHLRYEGLVAWDARGEELPARMEAVSGGLRLVVDTRHAVAPVYVDPVLPGAAWAADINQAGAEFGDAVGMAGDVNGDGFDDVVVGAPFFQDGQRDEGGAFLYLGSAGGLAASPAWTAESNVAGATLGAAVAAAGDVNGDGYGDVVVGAPGQSFGRGSASLYLGSPAGLGAVPAWSRTGATPGEAFGGRVASGGDVDGDGYDDVLVAAPAFTGAFASVGQARLFMGSAGGLGAPVWSVDGATYNETLGTGLASAGDLDGDGYDEVVVGAPGWAYAGRAMVYRGSAAGLAAAPAWVYEGESGDGYGVAVASAGDVNRDGFDDLLVGSYGASPDLTEEGAAFLYLGSAAGPSPLADWSARGGLPDAWFGTSVDGAGDLTGDGYDDVVIGAPGWSSDPADDGEGRAAVYLGSATGLRPSPLWSVQGGQSFAGLGSSVSSAGDVDGDGFADLLVGAPYFTSGQIEEGAAFVFNGFAPPDADGDIIYDAQDDCPAVHDPYQLDSDGDGAGDACDDPVLTMVGVASPGGLVSLVSTGGPGEVVSFGGAVGAGAAGPCPAALGGLCLDLGPGATPLGTAVVDVTGFATLQVTVPAGVQPNGTYTAQATIARGAGGADSVKSGALLVDGAGLDWDGDGLTDAIEQAIGTDPRLADSDGDGLTDVEDLEPHVSPLDPDSDGDGVQDGADVCLAGGDGVDGDGDGAPDACDSCPADADATVADADADGLGDACEGPVLLPTAVRVEGDQASLYLGTAMSSGDTNGDGYDDLVLGADDWDGARGSCGRAIVHLGSATGLQPLPAWTVEGGELDDFGSAVAVTDVNGDGYDDLVVGARGFDGAFFSAGRVSVYLGSVAGLQATPASTIDGDRQDFGLGSVIAAPGDVNGDGYDDVVFGAPAYNDGGEYEGAVFLHLGSAAGLQSAPAWSKQGGRAYAGLGAIVAGAGDVNGDGHGDLLVGSAGFTLYDVSLYLGTPTGFRATPSWSTTEPWTAAGAGDVNGDGYADVVVGRALDGNAEEGLAEVYLGSPYGLGATPRWSIPGDQPGALFGSSVAAAGDVDADGFDDLVVGAFGYDAPEVDEGMARLFLGSADGLAASPGWQGTVDQAGARLGTAVAPSGDVNGDGLGDVVVAATSWDGGQTNEGGVWLFTGDPR